MFVKDVFGWPTSSTKMESLYPDDKDIENFLRDKKVNVISKGKKELGLRRFTKFDLDPMLARSNTLVSK